MKNKFISLIETGEYEKAADLLIGMENAKIRDALILITLNTESLSVLGFAIYMSNRTQSEFWYDTVIALLLTPLCHLEGAYSFAFFYAKEELRLERSEENLTQLLFFNEIPEKLLSNTEALEIAKEILSINPNNEAALAVLKKAH